MTIFQVDEPALTLRQDRQCGCVNYLKRVSVMSEMSVWGRARGLIQVVIYQSTSLRKLTIMLIMLVGMAAATGIIGAFTYASASYLHVIRARKITKKLLWTIF
jgi:hypothetical protein